MRQKVQTKLIKIEEDLQLIGELADCFIEVLKHQCLIEDNLYNQYLDELRFRVHGRSNLKEKCMRGYEALLEMLQTKRDEKL